MLFIFNPINHKSHVGASRNVSEDGIIFYRGGPENGAKL